MSLRVCPCLHPRAGLSRKHSFLLSHQQTEGIFAFGALGRNNPYAGDKRNFDTGGFQLNIRLEFKRIGETSAIFTIGSAEDAILQSSLQRKIKLRKL
jgi:hypothetical protein